jgi:hypothetical protein
MNDTLAGLRPAQRDALRLLGATIFGAGALALFVRKSSQDQWAAFPKLVVLAIPCLLLYGLGTGLVRIGRADDQPGEPDAVPAWRSGALGFGLIFIPLTLFQLIETLGGDPDKSGHTAWVFAVTAGAGGYAALVRGLRWGALFGGLAAIVSWMAFWDAVVDPSGTAVRWLFLIIAAGLVAAAVSLERSSRREAAELVTAAGVAALAAGIVGLFSLVIQLAAGAVASALGADPDLGGAQQRQEWDAFLLLLALALIWYGLRAVWRGPVYVGALALFAFIVSVGSEITALFSGDAPSGDLVGWPLLLLLLGGAALGAGLFGGDSATREQPPAPAPPPTPPPAPPS